MVKPTRLTAADRGDLLAALITSDYAADAGKIRAVIVPAVEQILERRGAPTYRPGQIPLLCRLRGHGWRRAPVIGGWTRQTCARCSR